MKSTKRNLRYKIGIFGSATDKIDAKVKSKAKVFFSSSPKKLVEMLINAL